MLMVDAVLDFQAIHDEFRPKLLRYLSRMVGEYEAEDLTQEVLVKVSRALPAFRGESRISTWIYRIATNTALDKLRSPVSRQVVEPLVSESLASDDLELQAADPSQMDDVPSPEEQLFRQQRADCYQDFVEALPLGYRTVVALSEIEGLAAKEIAEILGLSLDVVKVRLHRGRLRLLQQLKSHCKAEDWL
jgi:RNA polymerase sigma-70 factor (ECF subfamily)